jgi:hypothetical protein
MTAIENTTHNGQPAVRITCNCKSHAGHGNTAVITGTAATALAARKGKAQSDRIHGFVLMANHPVAMLRKSAERDGVFAA